MTPADNPHKPGTYAWKAWEHSYINRRVDDPVEYAAMERTGRKRLDALKARTVWTDRQAEVAAVIAEVEEATRECGPGRTPRFKASEIGRMYDVPGSFISIDGTDMAQHVKVGTLAVHLDDDTPRFRVGAPIGGFISVDVDPGRTTILDAIRSYQRARADADDYLDTWDRIANTPFVIDPAAWQDDP